MVLDNEIVTGDALANKINDFFTSITNEITPLQPEPSENQFEFNECYIESQFIIDEEVCLTNCLIFLFQNRSAQMANQIGSLKITRIS